MGGIWERGVEARGGREKHIGSGTAVITVNKHGLPTRYPHVSREYVRQKSVPRRRVDKSGRNVSQHVTEFFPPDKCTKKPNLTCSHQLTHTDPEVTPVPPEMKGYSWESCLLSKSTVVCVNDNIELYILFHPKFQVILGKCGLENTLKNDSDLMSS